MFNYDCAECGKCGACDLDRGRRPWWWSVLEQWSTTLVGRHHLHWSDSRQLGRGGTDTMQPCMADYSECGM